MNDGVAHLRDQRIGALVCSYACGGKLCRQNVKDNVLNESRAPVYLRDVKFDLRWLQSGGVA